MLTLRIEATFPGGQNITVLSIKRRAIRSVSLGWLHLCSQPFFWWVIAFNLAGVTMGPDYEQMDEFMGLLTEYWKCLGQPAPEHVLLEMPLNEAIANMRSAIQANLQ